MTRVLDTVTRWLSLDRSANASSARKPRSTVRLSVEALETRCLLSAGVINPNTPDQTPMEEPLDAVGQVRPLAPDETVADITPSATSSAPSDAVGGVVAVGGVMWGIGDSAVSAVGETETWPQDMDDLEWWDESIWPGDQDSTPADQSPEGEWGFGTQAGMWDEVALGDPNIFAAGGAPLNRNVGNGAAKAAGGVNAPPEGLVPDRTPLPVAGTRTKSSDTLRYGGRFQDIEAMRAGQQLPLPDAHSDLDILLMTQHPLEYEYLKYHNYTVTKGHTSTGDAWFFPEYGTLKDGRVEITVPASYNDEQTAAAIVRVLNQAPQIGDNSVWRSFNHDWLRTVKAVESSEAYRHAQANLLAGSATTVAAGARVEVAIMSAMSLGGGSAELVVRASEGDVSVWDLPALLPLVGVGKNIVVVAKGKIHRYAAQDLQAAAAARRAEQAVPTPGAAPSRPRTALQIIEELPPGRNITETSPIPIPGRPIRPQDRIIPGTNRSRPLEHGEVEIRVATRRGTESGGRPYTNVEYRWLGDDGATYTARFHDATGHAPTNSSANWVVERSFRGDGIVGSPTERARTQFFAGTLGWVPGHEWHDAIRAFRDGTATRYQRDILRQGHVDVP